MYPTKTIVRRVTVYKANQEINVLMMALEKEFSEITLMFTLEKYKIFSRQYDLALNLS